MDILTDTYTNKKNAADSDLDFKIERVLSLLGGSENIVKSWHCMTRLRFELENEKSVDQDEIRKIPGVLGSQFQNSQFQIVIGPNVNHWHQKIQDSLGNTNNSTAELVNGERKVKPRGVVALLMDTVSGVFGPIVPAIAGAGMIKGLLAGFVALNIISAKSETVVILDIISSGVFYFLPFFLAISAAKMFKTNEYIAAAVAACLMYPTLIEAAKALAGHQAGATDIYWFAGLLPVSVMNYSASVLPIIFSILAMSYIHRVVDKYMPDVLKTVVTPTLALFISALVALTVIGPAGVWFGKGLAWCVQSLFTLSPVLAGLIVGTIRPLAVFTGMHHAMTPIALQNFSDLGYDMLMPMMFMANMSITGSTLAIWFIKRHSADSAIILSAAISGLLGIEEPALFGVLARERKAFIAVTIASAVSSAFIAFFGVRIYGYILSSIFSLPAYIGPYFIYALMGVSISLGLSFFLTLLFVRK